MLRPRFAFPLFMLIIGLTASPLVPSLSAATIYVDNILGDDINDGTADRPLGDGTGPVKSIRRALRIARRTDRVSIANNGTPYYESLSITGTKHSGTPTAPFTIQGNGVTISGARTVPLTAWEVVGNNLIRLVPVRKGHYYLMKNGKAIPEFDQPRDRLPEELLPAQQWCVYRGAIYYRAASGEDPFMEPFVIVTDSHGVITHNVRHVRIEGLKVQHFRLDGIMVHQLSYDVNIVGCTLTENGCAGLTMIGSARANANNCDITGNREHSLLILGSGQLNASECTFDPQPTVKPDTPFRPVVMAK